MASSPPTKPPRGVKQGKETSGLLMSVIRTLSASETNEQREKERAKLEKEYKKSDARLDELVAAHAQEIMDVMQKFTLVSQALSTWGLHCEAAVGRVSACRGLLRLKRDDLRRLWADARTHHHALNMLTDIERVVVSEREAVEQVSAGRVLAAAVTLRTATATADTTLAHVSALNATKAHLQAKRNELVDIIVRRLSTAVYRTERAPLCRRLSARRRAARLLAELTKSEEVTDEYLQDITPELEASLTEEDMTFETTAIISLEALGVLDKLREATEKFKCQIQNELLEVIDTTSRRIIEEGDVDDEYDEDGDIVESEGVTETGRPLARLVASLAEEFRACAARNKRLLQLWRAALQKYNYSESCLHTEQHYWSAVQQVMQLLLTEYLEISSVTAAAGQGRTQATPAIKISDCFAKKPIRTRPRLFRLTTPSSGIPAATTRRHTYPLVCQPAPAHLYAVLPALHALCADIEPLTGGGECTLRAFISDYVRTGESERLSAAARAQIEEATKDADAWRERTTPQPAAGKHSDDHRTVFSCCVCAWEAVRVPCVSARRCGGCAGAHAATAAYHAVATLATQCLSAQCRLKGSAGRAGRWLSDDDIVRFLQTLPNWTRADRQQQELNQAYEREAEILGSSLGDGLLKRSDIIADVNTLVDLAVFCESMDWLSANIKTIPSLISAPNSLGGVKLPDKFINDISSAALIFDDMANKCLLLLHLELRIECFYYLGQEDESSDGESDAECGADGGGGGGAARLAARLTAFHEQAHAVLARHRLAYIIEGLAEMMSAALIWRWQGGGCGGSGGGLHLVAGAGAGARRAVPALRHALAALRVPHAGLHRAQAYANLIATTEEEIIQSIQEKGPQFSELEYLNAFKVIGARRNLSPAEMRAHLKNLSAALGHVGVTV